MADDDSDQLIIRPLGAGKEVGRSCIMLQFKGKNVMLDCGIHPGRQGLDALPFFDDPDSIDPGKIDLLLISHFHLDHSGGLPWFFKETNFRGRCFMTHPTKAVYRWLLADFIRVSTISTEGNLFTEQDVEDSMKRIEVIDFHSQYEVQGIKFWCYNAGHVLGAAMFMIEIAGVRILYTGDYSREEDRHLMAAEIPSVIPDILIMESTYGHRNHDSQDTREARFCNIVADIINRGGKCLIPVFALGRAQELLLILEEYWASKPELHDIPVYYASSLAKRCMNIYATYINAMNDKIKQKQLKSGNPFSFKHISYLKNVENFEDSGPCVVLASPGMMQSGLSRQLFEGWCHDSKSGVIIAGYCVEGTLAKTLLSNPDQITATNGAKIPVNCSVDYISFSAHCDYQQNSAFVCELKPKHIILVHGEQNEMAHLKQALEQDLEESGVSCQIYTPKNTQPVEFRFRGSKLAKVIGKLAAKKVQPGSQVSGILVKKNFKYYIVQPDELGDTTNLSVSKITHRISCPFSQPFEALVKFLKKFLSPVTLCEEVNKPPYISVLNDRIRIVARAGENKTTGDNETLVVPTHVIVEWTGDPQIDCMADAILTAIVNANLDTGVLTIEQPVGRKKATASGFPEKDIPADDDLYSSTADENDDEDEDDDEAFRNDLVDMIIEMLGENVIQQSQTQEDSNLVLLKVGDVEATINPKTLKVQCSNTEDSLQQTLQTAVIKLYQAQSPFFQEMWCHAH